MLTPEQDARLRTISAETLGVSTDEIQDDTSPQTLEAWTSFSHLTLMAAVEDAFGCTLSMEEMTGIADFGDLRRLLAVHLS